MRIMRNIWSSLIRREVGSSDLLAGKDKICLKKNNRRSAIADNGAEASGMKTKALVLLTLLAASLWMCSPSPAASELLFSQNADGQSTYGPSQLWSASSVNSEIADDFNVVAHIDRVYASGFIWGAVNFQGVYVRFYQYGADNNTGELHREYF